MSSNGNGGNALSHRSTSGNGSNNGNANANGTWYRAVGMAVIVERTGPPSADLRNLGAPGYYQGVNAVPYGSNGSGNSALPPIPDYNTVPSGHQSTVRDVSDHQNYDFRTGLPRGHENGDAPSIDANTIRRYAPSETSAMNPRVRSIRDTAGANRDRHETRGSGGHASGSRRHSSGSTVTGSHASVSRRPSATGEAQVSRAPSVGGGETHRYTIGEQPGQSSRRPSGVSQHYGGSARPSGASSRYSSQAGSAVSSSSRAPAATRYDAEEPMASPIPRAAATTRYRPQESTTSSSSRAHGTARYTSSEHPASPTPRATATTRYRPQESTTSTGSRAAGTSRSTTHDNAASPSPRAPATARYHPQASTSSSTRSGAGRFDPDPRYLP
ncbi:MAG: hypothetical protein M4579_004008 [Chaenotheca gracillima]|nr:MAG: hypothetical protein M4579_004008 [Chaenotheca gracillima]